MVLILATFDEEGGFWFVVDADAVAVIVELGRLKAEDFFLPPKSKASAT